MPSAAAASIALRNGRKVVLRPVNPAANALIAATLTRLAPESGRRRFFTLRYRFSEAELERTTNLDGNDRFAVGATDAAADGGVEGVGVA